MALLGAELLSGETIAMTFIFSETDVQPSPIFLTKRVCHVATQDKDANINFLHGVTIAHGVATNAAVA